MVEMYLELEKFNARWNIKINSQEKFNILKGRLNREIQSVLEEEIYSKDIENEFIFVNGSLTVPKKASPMSVISQGLKSTNLIEEESKVIRKLVDSKTAIDFFRNLQILFSSNYLGRVKKEILAINLNDIIRSSGYSNIVFIKKEADRFLVYPAGEKFLDEEIVNKTIEGLEGYKTAYEIFIDSLEKYSNSENTGVENINIINSLRTSLENYLKEKFSVKSQSIESIMTRYVGKYLDSKNIDKNIREMYRNLAKSIEAFNNEHVKHTANLEISKEEVELFIYLTGTLVRFLESLK
ncbi:MAG: hypothetical protein E6469_10515 [Clostridium perfringens]|nr:hypothetical protein [Clostridium perfringens]HBI6962756.1 hypothetical protein [Clostridium perfringens]